MVPKMKNNDRNVAVGMVIAGKRLEDIAIRFNVSRITHLVLDLKTNSQ